HLTAVDTSVVALSLLRPPCPTATYTLSLHDALPIWEHLGQCRRVRALQGRPDGHKRLSDVQDKAAARRDAGVCGMSVRLHALPLDRKSTRLNSSHVSSSYAVFCLKKKTRLTCAMTYN